MKFLTDGMLGKLSRWLRLAGCDVIYVGDLGIPAENQDTFLIEKAKTEHRVLLTGDIILYRRATTKGIKVVFVGGRDVVKQLVEVSKRCGKRIWIDPKNSRCPVCNGVLISTPKSEIKSKVPATVFTKQDKFWLCTQCGKIYWQGKHWESILKMATEYEREID